jgi:hypothetical protein
VRLSIEGDEREESVEHHFDDLVGSKLLLKVVLNQQQYSTEKYHFIHFIPIERSNPFYVADDTLL